MKCKDGVSGYASHRVAYFLPDGPARRRSAEGLVLLPLNVKRKFNNRLKYMQKSCSIIFIIISIS